MGIERVHELARSAGVTSKDVLAFLQERGSFVRSASSTVSVEDAAAVRAWKPTLGVDEAGVDQPRQESALPAAPPLPPAEKQDADRWVVKATTRDGRGGYYGESQARNVGVIDHRGNAYRFATENEALGAAYHAKESGIFVDFALEALPLKPRFKTPGVDKEGNG